MTSDKIQNLFTTKFEIQNAIFQLEKIKEKLFRTDTNVEEEMKNNLNPAMQTLVIELVGAQHVVPLQKNIYDHETLRQLLSQIISDLKKIPVLKLTTGFEIKFRLAEKIAENLERAAKRKIILDGVQDKNLALNQVIIEYNGKRSTYKPMQN